MATTTLYLTGTESENFTAFQDVVNNAGDGDVINVNSNADANILFTNKITINDSIEINNVSSYDITFDGDNSTQLFAINAGGDTVNFDGFSFEKGYNSYSWVNFLFRGRTSDGGGAIEIEDGTVNISNSSFENNSSNRDGGAIDIETGTLNIDSTIFKDNSSGYDGGAINAEGGTVNVTNSAFEGNAVTSGNGEGAALYAGEYGGDAGVINVSGSVFEDNIVDANNNSIADEIENGVDPEDELDDFFADEPNGGEINIENTVLDDEVLEVDPDDDTEVIAIFQTSRFVKGPSSIEHLDGGGGTLTGVDFFGEEAGDWSSSHLENAGDVNGDGYDDFLIGSPYNGDSGAAYLVFGDVRGNIDYTDLANIGTRGIKILGENTGDTLAEVGALGDFNGDGIDDFILGARDAGPSNEGQAYVIFGQNDFTGTTIDLSQLGNSAYANGLVLTGENPGDDFAWQVTGAGDFNGDGYDDALVGGDLHDANGTSSGAAYVIYGSSNSTNVDLGLVSTGFLKLAGLSAYSHLGYSIDSIGDMNGDGFDDIILGAPAHDYSDYASGWGSAYVIFGGHDVSSVNLSSLSSDDGFVISAKDSGGDGLEWSAYDVSSGGDFNGDGYDDLIIGSGANNYEPGKVFVVFGGDTLNNVNLNDLNETANDSRGISITSSEAGDFAGFNVSTTGDFNGDGFEDIIFSTTGVDDPSDAYDSTAGIIYLIFGSSSPKDLDLTDVVVVTEGMAGDYETNDFYGLIIDGVHQDGELAAEVVNAGDVDGDGFDDFLIGEYFVSTSLDENIVYDPNDPGAIERSYAGDTYLIYGTGDLVPGAGIITELATDGTGTGTVVTDRFVGSTGNETFNNIADSDRVSAGAGNDIITLTDLYDTIDDADEDGVVNEDPLNDNNISNGDNSNDNPFMIIDGGSGEDTLIIDAGNIAVDLTNGLTNLIIKDIEVIQLNETGLKLDYQNLMNFSDRSSTLTIEEGSIDATLEFAEVLSSYTQSTEGVYTRYSYNQDNIFAEVLVHDDVTVSFA